MSIVLMIVQAAAGLGLFLYGMNMMGDSLQKVAGNKMKGFIQALTRNRFTAVLVGMIVTMIIQSSSATSVMVVGFVNAGIMTLSQAVGIILGANIGTTVTAQIVSFNLAEWAPVGVIIGLVLAGLTKNPKIKESAGILIGFGILFVGMTYMKDALKPLAEMPAFEEWIVQYGSNPILGVLIGFVLTVALQSSAATIGILMALAAQGIVPLVAALYIVYGDNIGTCTTALISSIGSSRKGKRVAVMHLSFNIIGTILFVLIFNSFVIPIVESMTPGNIVRQIANSHTIFNIVNVVLMFPFANVLIKISEFVIPDAKEKEIIPSNANLDERILLTPAIALKNTITEFYKMSETASQSLHHAIMACQQHDIESVNKTYESEKLVNQYEKNIIEYLVKISQAGASSDDITVIDELFNLTHDIERISDHADNIADNALTFIEKDIYLDEATNKDLASVYSLVEECYQLTVDSLSHYTIDKINQIVSIERQLDKLKTSIRDSHIKRMNKNIASAESGVFVMDLLSNLERVTDHCRNITDSMVRLNGRLAM